MDEARLVEGLPAVLSTAWGIDAGDVSPLPGPGGMGSATVQVDAADGGRFVAKWVPSATAEALNRGSTVALEVEQAGVTAGSPLPP